MSFAVEPSAEIRSEEKSASRFYRPELDVLRFLAFLSVFVYHAVWRSDGARLTGVAHGMLGFMLYVAGGLDFGVDLFFALSAYLITTLLLRERASAGAVDLQSFYLRRILRIWPLYFAFLALCFVLSLIPATGQLLLRHYLIGYLLMAGNWVYVFYGTPTASLATLLWTVSMEEQFYLLWPLAMRRATVRRMAGLALGALVVGNLYRIAVAAAVSHDVMTVMGRSTFSRVDAIPLGILLALFETKLPRLRRWQRFALLFSGLAVWMFVHQFCYWTPWPMVFGYPAIAVAAVAILWSFLGSQHAVVKNRGLIYLGKISYGLYVFHMLALWCAARIVHPAKAWQKLAEIALALLIAVVLAAGSYRWLESPFLRLKERMAHVPSRPV